MAIKFLKTGVASTEAAAKEAILAKQRKESQGKMFRFFLKQGEEAKITFIDGDLDADGNLTPTRLFEHNVQINGKWNNFFPCPELSDPTSGEKCPICAEGKFHAYLAALFTIIDHRSFTSTTTKKTYVDQRRLFVAKPQTFEMLQKLAAKRGGLAGALFDVSRNNDNQSAAVGSMFDFDKKSPIETVGDVKGLKDIYLTTIVDPTTNAEVTVSNFVPADYEHEFTFRSAAELAKLGLGTSNPSAGAVSNPAGNAAGVTDYADKF